MQQLLIWTEDSEFRIAKGKEVEVTKVQTCALASASGVIRPTVIQPDHDKIRRPITLHCVGITRRICSFRNPVVTPPHPHF